jgi:hypothetical protein
VLGKLHQTIEADGAFKLGSLKQTLGIKLGDISEIMDIPEPGRSSIVIEFRKIISLMTPIYL